MKRRLDRIEASARSTPTALGIPLVRIWRPEATVRKVAIEAYERKLLGELGEIPPAGVRLLVVQPSGEVIVRHPAGAPNGVRAERWARNASVVAEVLADREPDFS